MTKTVKGNLAEVKEKFDEGKLMDDIKEEIYIQNGYEVIGEISKEDLDFLNKNIQNNNMLLARVGELEIKKQMIIEQFKENNRKQHEFELQLSEKYKITDEMEINLKEGKIIKKVEKKES